MAAHQQDHKQFKGALHSMQEKLTQDLIQVKSSFEEVKLEIVEIKCSIKEVQKTMNQVLSYLPLLQKSALPSNSSSLPHQAESSASKCLQLRFQGELPNTLLTKNNIEDEGTSLTVELCDDTGERVEVVPELCLKNLKVKFLALDGDFEVENIDDWTEDDFKKYVASPRKDKPPLLKGNCEVSLSEGAARVCGISFTDNSKSMRNGNFRLGAQVIKGLPFGWVVRPAVSKAFQVKENRLKSDQKHTTPSPTDELYRLKNINKTGTLYRRALKHEVVTVMDFLQLYHTDAREMQKILQVTGMKWEETVKNAKACNITKESYKFGYHDDASGDFLLLKCDFNIESVTFKGQTSQSYESLDESQKEKIGILRKAAYKKRKELRKVHDSTNQSPVQAGFSRLRYLSSVEQQEQEEQEQQQPPPPPPFNMDSNVPNVVALSDHICSNPCTNPYLGTTAAYHDSCQQDFINMSASLTTGAYGVQDTAMGVGNNLSVAYENLTEQVADNGLDSQQFSDITATNQGEIDMQHMFHDPSANMMPSPSPISFSDIGGENFIDEDLNQLLEKWRIEQRSRRWCTVRVVPLVICRWKRRRALRCRPQKKQKN